MATTIDDLQRPEFAGVRSALCRLYLKHRDVLGMADQPKQFIVDRVDDITATLLGLTARALLSAVPLDG
jgi:hypothetical protein